MTSKRSSETNQFLMVKRYLEANFEFRYNTISNSVEMRLKTNKDDVFNPCNDSDVYCKLKEEGYKISQSDLKAILGSYFVEKYNPIVAYFNAVKEEFKSVNFQEKGESEIDKLCCYVVAKDQKRFVKHFKKAIIRTLACVLLPKMVNKQVFVLVGEKQNIGKTTLIRFLIPEPLKEYYTENIGTDKDSQIAICENFIISLDELATIGKQDLNKLKAMFSKDSDKSRRPFDSRPIRRTRIASFFGTTNNIEFLSDPTGSVRWLCFEIDGIDFKYSNEVNIDKIWAEAYFLFENKFQYQLTADEIKENELANRTHQIVTPEMELIPKLFKQATQKDYTLFLTATEILNELNKNFHGLNLNSNNVGKAMTQLGFIRGQKDMGKFPVKGYYLDST